MNAAFRPATPVIFAAALVSVLSLSVAPRAHAAATGKSRYAEVILVDKPVAYWRLNEQSGATVLNLANTSEAAALNGEIIGKVQLKQPAQSNEQFPEFEPDSTAAAFAGKGEHIRVKDPGANSPLDFAQGDSITMEAWVFANSIKDGQQVYILGKGRTGTAGFAPDNQNYALRLRGEDDAACVSFLFRDAVTPLAKGSDKHWHRWTTTGGFAPSSGWHHVAVTYTFGKSDTIRGYIDGNEVKGKWDMGGKSDNAPIVDNDELWIGSALGGSAGNSFNGLINEVAIYRRSLAAKDIKARYNFVPVGPKVTLKDLPKDTVRVEIVEGIPQASNWNFTPGAGKEVWTTPAFAFVDAPEKYSARGIRVDRTIPFLMRAAGVVKLPAGEHRLLLRSLQSARLFMDGQLLATTKFIIPNGSGHGEVPAGPGDEFPAGLRYPRVGHNDQWITVKSKGGEHVFVLEAIIGGKGLRPETGELSVSIAKGNELFRLLAPKESLPHTDEGWAAYEKLQLSQINELDARNRKLAAAEDDKYWARRHEVARQTVGKLPSLTVPELPAGQAANNAVDRFIAQKLASAKAKPAPLVDDLSFLRRLAIDTVGLPPTPKQIAEFQADKSPNRRASAVDRFLAEPDWADNWVSYWQDVLAENPGILKPTLNNTGPFRWWIYESFLDNKPMDRFATELVTMEGSVYGGGPAGFGLATQNDVPMADRAQIVSSAFLAMNLACARCHDAPYHDFKQEQLFSMAAMLNQGAQEVPKSSSIPSNANIKVGRLVNVTLHPGAKVEPAWPFAKVMHGEFGAGELREAGNTREQLAAFITDPRNERFAKVTVNRIWKRYLGEGFVEPVDDWETAKASHPELLDWLAREFMANGYDVKHVARLIFNSQTYQRVAGLGAPASDDPASRLFASPARRRLSAEQVVDSLFAVVGKEFDTEPLTLDADGRRPAKDFLNLGVPRRAWEFTGFANDRDRPALSMPKAQAVSDVLALFGWRETRQSALSARNDSPNVLQPASLANGDMANGRLARLSDDSVITELCLQQQPLAKLTESVFLRVLSRPPTAREQELFARQLEPGYAERVVPGKEKPLKKDFDKSLLISWSNHLNAKATDIKLEVERRVHEGDVATDRLRSDWRERMEDALWAVLNSPEFVMVP